MDALERLQAKQARRLARQANRCAGSRRLPDEQGGCLECGKRLVLVDGGQIVPTHVRLPR